MNGGLAGYAVADADDVFKLSDGAADAQAAPLVCAGPSGYRAYGMTGGGIACAGIHMSDIPVLPYGLLQQKRSVRSLANVTQDDAKAFLALAWTIPVKTRVRTYPLADANCALADVRGARLQGAAVVTL